MSVWLLRKSTQLYRFSGFNGLISTLPFHLVLRLDVWNGCDIVIHKKARIPVHLQPLGLLIPHTSYKVCISCLHRSLGGQRTIYTTLLALAIVWRVIGVIITWAGMIPNSYNYYSMMLTIVHRFVDDDMSVRYLGMGIGHLTQLHFKDVISLPDDLYMDTDTLLTNQVPSDDQSQSESNQAVQDVTGQDEFNNVNATGGPEVDNEEDIPKWMHPMVYSTTDDCSTTQFSVPSAIGMGDEGIDMHDAPGWVFNAVE
jgi:hypothetical protein